MIGYADNLAGTVVRDVATASCLVHFDARARELRVARGDMRPAAVA